jgi:hypothetical protein
MIGPGVVCPDDPWEGEIMREHQQYRIKSPTMAIHSVDGQRTTVMVPTGDIVRASQRHLDGDVLIEVTWNEKQYLMFTQDLRERSEAVEDSARSG